ncbi:MAG: ABC transporter ATP-binding protein [Elainellaceae cyanobacterium]
MSIVKAEGFTFTYPADDEPVLKNVSFNVEQGEVLGLIGPIGAGKTTLCMAIAGFVPSVTGGNTSGKITVADRDAQELSDPNDSTEGDISQRVGVVFEDYAAQIIQLQVLEEVVTPLRDRGLSADEATSRARDLLGQVGLGDRDLENRRVWELAGGQQLRLALAAVLAIDPPILVLDNVLDKFDPREQARVIQVVKDLAGEKTFIIVEQNVTLIQDLCDRLLVLADGEVIEEGQLDDVLRNQDVLARADVLPPISLRVARDIGLSKQPLTFDALEQAIGGSQRGANGGNGSHRWNHEQDNPDSYRAAPQSHEMPAHTGNFSQELFLDAISSPPPESTSQQRQQNDSATNGHFGQPVIQVQNVTFCYKNDGRQFKALDNVSITVREGEVHGVIGRSGAGKTTLIQLIAGLLHPNDGKILIGDVDTKDTAVPDLALTVGTILQRPDDQLSEKTVREELVFPMRQRQKQSDRYDDDYIETRRSQVCEMLGIDESWFDEDPFLLSWGQRKLVTIAEVLTIDPAALIIDESSVGFGETSHRMIHQAISRLCDQGKAVLITGNNVDFITGIADTVTILEQGRVALQGSVQDVFAEENWERLSELHFQPPSVARLSHQVGVSAVKYDELVSQLASK